MLITRFYFISISNKRNFRSTFEYNKRHFNIINLLHYGLYHDINKHFLYFLLHFISCKIMKNIFYHVYSLKRKPLINIKNIVLEMIT